MASSPSPRGGGRRRPRLGEKVEEFRYAIGKVGHIKTRSTVFDHDAQTKVDPVTLKPVRGQEGGGELSYSRKISVKAMNLGRGAPWLPGTGEPGETAGLTVPSPMKVRHPTEGLVDIKVRGITDRTKAEWDFQNGREELQTPSLWTKTHTRQSFQPIAHEHMPGIQPPPPSDYTTSHGYENEFSTSTAADFRGHEITEGMRTKQCPRHVSKVPLFIGEKRQEDTTHSQREFYPKGRATPLNIREIGSRDVTGSQFELKEGKHYFREDPTTTTTQESYHVEYGPPKTGEPKKVRFRTNHILPRGSIRNKSSVPLEHQEYDPKKLLKEALKREKVLRLQKRKLQAQLDSRLNRPPTGRPVSTVSVSPFS